jgi:hypothetical protein
MNEDSYLDSSYEDRYELPYSPLDDDGYWDQMADEGYDAYLEEKYGDPEDDMLDEDF